jgi:hypothetical protein
MARENVRDRHVEEYRFLGWYTLRRLVREA